jgi:hypothetical protein
MLGAPLFEGSVKVSQYRTAAPTAPAAGAAKIHKQ